MNRRAGANIPWLSFLSYKRLSAHTLFYGRRVIIQESAAKKLSQIYGGAVEAAPSEEVKDAA
jgi:large subunit ribosomal protein L4